MIPVKLAMRNFMCYRENVPPLYFDSIHTACISGSNGHGKSALIDAMTWALWGQSRAASDDELIHAGQTEVEVEFEFASGGQRYRIIRKHSKPKHSLRSGQTILELQAATVSAGSPQAGEGFKPITGDTVTQTQQKLLQILHMDYDTFINSAFLRQGHADEFTRKRPGERKQVLASILQLDVYDELETKARDMAKTQESDKAQLESAIRDIDVELTRKPVYEVELEKAQSQLFQAEKLTVEQEAKLASLRREKESLENARTQLTALDARVQDTERNRSRWDEQVRQHHARIKEYEGLIAESAGIESGYLRFHEAKKTCQELDQKFKTVTALNKRQHNLEMAIYKAGQTLYTGHALAQNTIKELEKTLENLPDLQKQLEQVQSQLRHLSEVEAALEEKKQKGKEIRAKVHYVQAETDRLKREIGEIKDKLDLLAADGGNQCPLCESELGPEGRTRIETKYLAERDEKTDSLKSKVAEIARGEAELKSLENDIAQIETRLNQSKAAEQGKLAVLGKSINEAEEARSRLSQEKENLADIEQRLAGRQFAIAEQEALAQIMAETDRLGYDAQEHEQVRLRLTDLEQYEAKKLKLDEAGRLITRETDAAAKAQATVQELLGTLETDNRRKQELVVLLRVYPRLISDLAQAEAGFQALLLQQKQAQELLGGVKAKLERCNELEIRRKEKQTQLDLASEQEKVYKELAQAFGKKGIQAMLIEIALPEIENEATKLLARMTDNRMHVKIETQRASKKGDLLETLDINISDELGTRNYEMFSGGEAFRIDFAIRIALSKLLARRAGAPLPTLIIDEGFGTQDSAGIEKLKEAINSIQDDFEKILVITHIAELRDAFPTRIEVVKTPEGSTLFLD